MNNSWLATEELCRYYHRGEHTVKAVDNVNLIIEKSEFVAIVGSSGSGKSTLLNLLAGLGRPTSGDISFEHRSLVSMNRKELSRYRAHKIGMVFQSFNLISHYTALENVAAALLFNDTPSKKRKILAGETLEQLGLKDRLDHHPSDLSGGEQQRVALARALIKKPEILFADEPTGNLDRENSLQIIKQIKKLNTDGLTVVMVTHDLNLAGKYANRTIKMDYGKIINGNGGDK